VLGVAYQPTLRLGLSLQLENSIAGPHRSLSNWREVMPTMSDNRRRKIVAKRRKFENDQKRETKLAKKKSSQ
jgi:hypothetical protein